MSSQFIKVNDIDIEIIIDGNERYVPIKPICDAIGVNYTTQLEKIDEDEILSQLTPLRGTVAKDNKNRKMRCISLKYVFGWLFTISPKNVPPETKQVILKYRQECYNALYDYFTRRQSILKERENYYTEKHNLKTKLAEESEDFKRLKELDSLIKNASQRLNKMDKGGDDIQTELFTK